MKWLFALCLLSGVAAADSLTWTWTTPTQREDGTALPLSEIKEYKVNWTLNGTALTPVIIPGTLTTYTLSGLAPGRYCANLTTVDTDGLESAPTGDVCRKARPKPPGSPGAR